MTQALGVLSLAFACLSLFGWGVAARRLASLREGAWPMTIALGFAVWIILGGLLNLLRLAQPPALDALALAGAALAAARLRASGRRALLAAWPPRASGERGHRLAWYALVAALTGFALATQLKPALYNHHDDFEKYFAHAARMVQTGTLYGSPLNSLGSATLGGQAFLQGIVVAHAPIAYINAGDAVFCLLLTLLLAGGVAIGRPSAAPAAVLGVLATALINPQYVNIGALYSGAALLSALALATADDREHAADGSGPSPAAVGLIYAALAALKTTFVFFAALHFLFAAAAAASARRPAAELRRVLASAAWGLAFLAPWLALYAPYYLTASANPPPPMPMPPPADPATHIFSLRPLFYGATFAQYTFLAAAILGLGAAALARRRGSEPARFAAVCGAAVAGYLAMVLAFRAQFGLEGGLRFAVPLLIAAAALPGVYAAGAPPRGRAAAALLAFAVSAGFAPDAARRARRLLDDGSMLAYLPSKTPQSIERLKAFGAEALDGAFAARVEALQRLVPPGEPLLVWHCAPFLLDFARNPIIDANPSGLMAFRTKVPAYSYVLWRYGGYGTRQPAYFAAEMKNSRAWGQTYEAARGWELTASLMDSARRSEVLSDDGQTILFRIPPPGAPGSGPK